MEIYGTPIRQRCPRCGDDMMRMYRQRCGSSSWNYVWFCLSCRHEVVMPEEPEPTNADRGVGE